MVFPRQVVGTHSIVQEINCHYETQIFMTLLKQINKASLLLRYEQLRIQTYHQHMQLISEQYICEHNPIYQLIHNTLNTSPPTRPAAIPH